MTSHQCWCRLKAATERVRQPAGGHRALWSHVDVGSEWLVRVDLPRGETRDLPPSRLEVSGASRRPTLRLGCGECATTGSPTVLTLRGYLSGGFAFVEWEKR